MLLAEGYMGRFGIIILVKCFDIERLDYLTVD